MTVLVHATEEEMQFVEAELLLHRKSGRVLEVKIISDDEDSQKSPSYEATTLLHLAAKYGNIKATQYFIDSGYNVNITNPSGCTPLMIAIHFDERKIIQMLLDANADIFLRNHVGESAANLAFQNTNIALLILDNVKYTCSNDSQTIAKKFLEINCSLAQATLFKDTSIVKYMLDHGRAADEPDFSNRTALHYAVRLLDVNMIKLLLDRGSDVNALGKYGQTPLFHYCAKSEDTSEKLEVLKTLLDRGASITIRETSKGLTPADILLGLGQRGTVEILLEHISDVCTKNSRGVPLLHALMANCNPGITAVWMNRNWDFNVLDTEGRNALFSAAILGSIGSVKALLKKGVDANAADSRGYTVLFYLSLRLPAKQITTRNRLKCAEILLRHGSDAQYTIAENFTIFDYILKRNSFTLAKIVIAHLALMEEVGKPIKILIIIKINSDVRFKRYFNLCKQWLNKMRKFVICGSLTLFNFLTENGSKMRVYARNPSLVQHLQRVVHTQRRSNMYYCNVLRRRIKTVIRNAELKKQVTFFISKNRQLCSNDYLIEKIVEFIM